MIQAQDITVNRLPPVRKKKKAAFSSFLFIAILATLQMVVSFGKLFYYPSNNSILIGLPKDISCM
jgi:hypothetical protein